MSVQEAPVKQSVREDRDPVEILKDAFERHGDKIAIACSFQAEEIVIFDMMYNLREDARLFSLDTGRLDEETYEVAEQVRRHYGCNIEWVHPQRDAVEGLIREKGLYSFRQSVENRKECCFIRKVEPLNRVLDTLDAWITGLRREQAVTRGDLPQIEYDVPRKGLEKINPIIHWDTRQVWDYIKERNLPFNRLYERGYTQIGCECCTRAIKPGDNVRDGRWWWESPEHKECGLHAPKQAAGSGI